MKGTLEEAFNEGSELYGLLQFENDCLVEHHRYGMEMKHHREMKMKVAEELPVSEFFKKLSTQRSEVEK